MKVMIVVTHLLGTGHLRRAVELGHAFDKAGHDVTLVSGGTPVAGLSSDPLRLVQLPALQSDGVNFTHLLTASGDPASGSYLAHRQSALLTTLQATQPDILVTELFPFGRRVLSAEFTALLGSARTQTSVILCSVRDILAPPSKPEKATKTEALIAAYYDAVLVHADPKATSLSDSWPVTPALEAKLHYTGFVAPPAPKPHPDLAGAGEILISAGGGAVGQPLFDAAKQAASLITNKIWRILVGGIAPNAVIADLRRAAPPNLIVEAARPDFRTMLLHAACSVSLAGYNTAMDLLQTSVPAVLVPYDDGAEVEQTLRAKALARMPGIDLLPSADLSAANLAKAVSQAMQNPRRSPGGVAMSGAQETVRIATELVKDQ